MLRGFNASCSKLFGLRFGVEVLRFPVCMFWGVPVLRHVEVYAEGPHFGMIKCHVGLMV